MKYSEQLLNPKWIEKRAETIAFYGHQCQRCFERGRKMEVHHRIYKPGSLAWEYELKELTVLCHECHELFKFFENCNFSEAISKIITGVDKTELFLILYRIEKINPFELLQILTAQTINQNQF